MDHILTVLITLVLPAYDVILWQASRLTGARMIDNRIVSYQRTAMAEWVVAILVVAGWMVQSRSLAQLGFGFSNSLGFWGALTAGLLIATVLTWQRAEIFTGAHSPEELKQEIQPAEGMLPRTPTELKWFIFVSITAGITEEVFFRGFMIWYLKAMIPLGWAVAVSCVLFGVAHAYQGIRGIITNSLVALPLAGLALWSGSLWIPILVHSFININSGLTAYSILGTPKNRG
jgi:membrane protease YdiL (CAAX protease family)